MKNLIWRDKNLMRHIKKICEILLSNTFYKFI